MGIDVTDHSTAELADVTMQRNQQGIDALNASLVILRGHHHQGQPVPRRRRQRRIHHGDSRGAR